MFFGLGDNSDIIATDSQKNTVYLLAKKFGVKSPEDFAITLTRHFLSKYRHVKEAHVHVQEYPWERIRYTNNENMSKQHNHAYLFTPVATRYCDVIHQRGKYTNDHTNQPTTTNKKRGKVQSDFLNHKMNNWHNLRIKQEFVLLTFDQMLQ